MSLQELADQYNAARRIRLTKEKEAEKLQEVEMELYWQLLAKMRDEKLTVVGGQSCIVRYHKNDEPRPQDWPEIWAYIKESGEFDLLTHKLAPAAVKARWEEGVEIPGIVRFPVEKLTVSQTK